MNQGCWKENIWQIRIKEPCKYQEKELENISSKMF